MAMEETGTSRAGVRTTVDGGYSIGGRIWRRDLMVLNGGEQVFSVSVFQAIGVVTTAATLIPAMTEIAQ